MPALRFSADSQPPAHRSAPIAAHLRPVLTHIRIVALQCRSAARSDLFEACAVLSGSKNLPADTVAMALVRGLPTALGKRPAFYGPGSVDMSFDEAWIMRALQSIDAGDLDSLTFLISARIVPEHRRHIAFLLRRLATPVSDAQGAQD